MQPATRRLLPLFIGTIFGGLIFWYPIQILYMFKLGFDTRDVTTINIISYIVILLFEVPTGILADRWSRKGVWMLGIAALGIGSYWEASVHSLVGFAVGYGIVSIFWAVETGLAEAIIYDTLIEDNKKRKGYEKLLGRQQAAYSAALVVASLAGGLIARYDSFTAAFKLSSISCLLAILVISRIREPKLHKQGETVEMKDHISQLLRSVFQQPETAWLMLTAIVVGVLANFMLTVDQLWPVALALPVVWFGPLNALSLSGVGIGGMLAEWANNKRLRLLLAIVLMIIGTLGLTVHHLYVVIPAEVVLLTSAILLTIVLTGRMQDRMPASQRAGVGSLASTLGNACYIPSLFLFGRLASHHGIFIAAFVLVGFGLLSAIGMLRSLKLAPTTS